jgi:hypothetical protein
MLFGAYRQRVNPPGGESREGSAQAAGRERNNARDDGRIAQEALVP